MNAQELCKTFLNGREAAYASAKQSAWLKGQLARERYQGGAGRFAVGSYSVAFSPVNGCAYIAQNTRPEACEAFYTAREAYHQALAPLKALQVELMTLAESGENLKTRPELFEALSAATEAVTEAKEVAREAFAAYKCGSQGTFEMALA